MTQRGSALAKTFLFTLVVPGFVTGVVPWWLRGNSRIALRGTEEWLAISLIAAGIAIYLHTAFWSFAWIAGGTPAPISPTNILAVRGLYRFVRNPMYIGVGSIVAGQAWLFLSAAIAMYLALLAVVVHLFVRFYEEPTLQKQFGKEYERYKASVPRWLPRIWPR